MQIGWCEVRLLSSPLEKDYLHTLYFDNAGAQETYFANRTVDRVESASYQRQDNVIRYPKHYDLLSGCNYLMYKNSQHSNKWIYAFIVDKTYINDERTDIKFEVDVMQTYMFDYTVKASFVEREHVNNDSPGLHILDEGLQLGEYVSNLHQTTTWAGSAFYVVVGVGKVKFTDDKWYQSVGGLYNNLFSGLTYRAFPYNEVGVESLSGFLRFYDEEGHAEDVQSVFLAPASLVTLMDPPTGTADNYGGWVKPTSTIHTTTINNGTDGKIINFTTDTLDGYTPRNKKLLTYPFRYLLIANNNGVSTVFKFENFYGNNESGSSGNMNTPKFVIEACLSPGCSVRLIPLDYKGISRNDEEGVNLGKFPALNWTSDAYTNWMTQNAVNIGVDITSGVLMTAIGIAGAVMAPGTGGASLGLTAVAVGSATVSGVTGIAKTMGEINKASMAPAQSKGNTNCGDIVAVSGQNDFHFYDMSIKSQYAKILDGFFDMFGYKVHEVKIPNKNHRKNYWYTKTQDINIEGNIPSVYKLKIKECYNNGLTFWKDASVIGDYSVNNDVV